MAKKEKLKPAILHTREAMEAEVAEYVRLKLAHLAELARMEQLKARIEKKFAGRLGKLTAEFEVKFASVQAYCETHRVELMPDKKSFETVSAVLRFRDTPPAVGKLSSKETWEGIALRLQALQFDLGDGRTLVCDAYVREAKPSVDKDALLSDRTAFTPEQLRAMGICFSQEEHFYIEPKSDVVPVESKEAA